MVEWLWIGLQPAVATWFVSIIEINNLTTTFCLFLPYSPVDNNWAVMTGRYEEIISTLYYINRNQTLFFLGCELQG